MGYFAIQSQTRGYNFHILPFLPYGYIAFYSFLRVIIKLQTVTLVQTRLHYSHLPAEFYNSYLSFKSVLERRSKGPTPRAGCGVVAEFVRHSYGCYQRISTANVVRFRCFCFVRKQNNDETVRKK